MRPSISGRPPASTSPHCDPSRDGRSRSPIPTTSSSGSSPRTPPSGGNRQKVFVSHLLGRLYVGLEEVGDGVWSVFFGPVHLGWLDERDYRIMDVTGKK